MILPVQNPPLVAEEHSLQQLVGVAAHQVGLHELAVLDGVDVLLQVHGQELEDQVQAVLLHDDVHQTDDVGVLRKREEGGRESSDQAPNGYGYMA